MHKTLSIGIERLFAVSCVLKMRLWCKKSGFVAKSV